MVSQCMLRGIVRSEDRWYCKRHDPAAKALREEKWEMNWQARKKAMAHAEAIQQAERRVIIAAKAWYCGIPFPALAATLREAVTALVELEEKTP